MLPHVGLIFRHLTEGRLSHAGLKLLTLESGPGAFFSVPEGRLSHEGLKLNGCSRTATRRNCSRGTALPWGVETNHIRYQWVFPSRFQRDGSPMRGWNYNVAYQSNAKSPSSRGTALPWGVETNFTNVCSFKTNSSRGTALPWGVETKQPYTAMRPWWVPEGRLSHEGLKPHHTFLFGT